MMTTKPHTHYCPKCHKDVGCDAAATGGCPFASTSQMTCNPCAAVATTPSRHDDIDSRDKPCECATGRHEDCPRHGIAASNERQNRYWQRVGGHD